MIREPEWKFICKAIEEYPHFVGRGLRVLVGKRTNCEFQISDEFSEVRSYSLKELIGQMFCVYYDEDMREMAIDESVLELYERVVLLHFDRAKREISLLIQSTEHLNKKQIPTKLQKLVTELDGLEPRLRKAWTESFQGTVEKVDSEALGNLGEEGAETRLVINLWDVLSEFTNLTKENKIEHIVQLLHHFEIGSEDGYSDRQESVRQLLHGRLGRGKERRDAAERKRMLKQWAIKTRIMATAESAGGLGVKK